MSSFLRPFLLGSFFVFVCVCAHKDVSKFYSGQLCSKADFYADLEDEFSMGSAVKDTLKTLKLQKIDAETIKFMGAIEDGDAEAFNEMLKLNPKRLVVKSGGEIPLKP